jgi:3'-phosphoadenosine 5'-phosphosulfate sulfotransferase (PAPS reductase)/FAD synthetase
MNAIDSAINEFSPVALYALYSGGNDSLVSTHFAMSHGAHEVVHVCTGIGIPQTLEHVRQVCKDEGWPLRVLTPPDKTYRDFVLKYGFPGPGSHRYAYSWLKERALRKLVRESKYGAKDRIGLITGVRVQESARRMGYVKPVIRMGCTVWIAPMFGHSKADNVRYIREHELPINPVTRILGMSGECLCGAFAQPNELEAKIRPHFPEVAAQIDALAEEARIAGKHCAWGTRPKKAKLLDQYDIPWMPLCSGCPTKIGEIP